MEEGVKMVSAITEVLSYRKQNPMAKEEDILHHIFKFARIEKDKKTKMGMLAAASKTVQIFEKNPRLTEKEVIREVMKELPGILLTINEE